MATISEPVPIAHVKDACLKSVGLSYGHKKVTVTYDSKLVSVVEVDSQKTVHSWSVRRGQIITSPAVCNEEDTFYTVVDGKEVKIWLKDEQNLEKCRKKHFKFNIHQIHVIKGYELVVVCQNGAVDFLSKIKDSNSSGLLNDADVILESEAFIIRGNVFVVCLVKKQNGQMTVLCHTWTGEDTSSWGSISRDIDIPVNTGVLTCSLKLFTNDVRCYLLCKTGNLYKVVLSPLSNDVDVSCLCTVNGVTDFVAMVILNSTHIALAGIQNDNQSGIGIFDTRFEVMHQFKPFSEPVTDKVKIFHCYDSLFVYHDKTLYMYKYTCQKSTVATILGKQDIKSDPQNKKQEKKDSEKGDNLKNLIVQLSDKTIVTNYKPFSEKFNKVQSLLCNEDGPKDLMLPLIQRCLTEEKFYPKSEIQFLIKELLIPTVCITNLTDTLIKNRDSELLHTMLLHLSNIPESCLCKSLQFLLSLDEKDLIDVTSEQGQRSVEGCPLSATRIHYVNQILQMPFNDVFLVECIRTLTFQNVLIMLEYLFFLLSMGQDQRSLISNVPSLSQIVDWLCSLLDGHFTQLIISPDARKVLVHLHTEVESKVEFYEELLSLDALLQQLKSKCAIPHNKMVGQYCIEVLHIL